MLHGLHKVSPAAGRRGVQLDQPVQPQSPTKPKFNLLSQRAIPD